MTTALATAAGAPSLHIRRFHSRYRIGARDAQATVARLDRVRQTLVDGVLEGALARVGIPPHEEICVRQVRVRVWLRAGASDFDWLDRWSRAFAGAVKLALDAGDGRVVRYGSPNAALADMAASILGGDLARAWAWRQLGLWRLDSAAGETGARRELRRALLAAPAAILPVLQALAGTPRGPTLLARLPLDDWPALAAAARGAWAAPVVRAAGGAPEPRSAAGAPDVALRVARRSALARAARHILGLAPSGPRDSRGAAAAIIAEAARALAALAILEVDGQVFAPPADIDAVTRALEPTLHAPAALADGRQRTAEPRDGARPDAAPPARATTDARTSRSDPGGRSPPVSTPPARAATEVRVPETRREDEPAGAPSARDPRVRGWTEHAGLLFLLHVVGEQAIPARLGAGAPGAIAVRAPRLIWHQLALALTGVGERDAAALAFAGLRPDAEPPSLDEPPLDADEQAFVSALADQIVRAAAERIANASPTARRREAAPGRLPAAAIVQSLCRRRGQIVADPGWFDVHLQLDDVSTELRRAGLDLDPGFVPWLGVTVRFIYA
jgi:hypothetical protein